MLKKDLCVFCLRSLQNVREYYYDHFNNQLCEYCLDTAVKLTPAKSTKEWMESLIITYGNCWVCGIWVIAGQKGLVDAHDNPLQPKMVCLKDMLGGICTLCSEISNKHIVTAYCRNVYAHRLTNSA